MSGTCLNDDANDGNCSGSEQPVSSSRSSLEESFRKLSSSYDGGGGSGGGEIGLTVITKGDGERFAEAVTSRSFISNLPAATHDGDDDHANSVCVYPDAVLIAKNVRAVQAAVDFCRENNLRVSPRTGGHNWSSIWLQGRGTVLLDVGDIDHVRFDPDSETISAGPGATDVNDKIPPEYFFPTGHCPMVPLGGFILGACIDRHTNTQNR